MRYRSAKKICRRDPIWLLRSPASYFEAFIEWEQTYNNYKVEPEWICFAPEGGAGNQFGHSVFHTASGSGDRAHTGVLSFP